MSKPGFKLTHHTSPSFDVENTEVSRAIFNKEPLLIFLVLPCVQLKSLDALFQLLGPGASSVPIVVVVLEADQEELIELVAPAVADFIISPVRDAEILARLRRVA